jgi:hypothetical protein
VSVLITRLTDGPVRSSIQVVRGLLRLLVVAFTVISLLLVAAVGVAASSGKIGTSNTVKHSVVAVFSGHFDQSGFHEGGTEISGKHNGHEGDECRPSKKKNNHHHETGDEENNQCGRGDDSGSSG